MRRGFVNLNRFKHSRTIKQDSRRKPDWQGKKKVRGKDVEHS